MRIKMHNIFFGVTILCVLIIVGLFIGHVYVGDSDFRPARNLMPPVSEFLMEGKHEFSIAIISDSGTHNHVLERVIDAARVDANPEFIMYLGDLVSDRQPANFYWMLHEIERHLAGDPFYMIPGNHDVEKHGHIDKEFYKSVMGPTYYWFGYGDTLFIGMDSSDDIDEKQFEWLADTLNNVRPTFRHCVIFSHMPPVNPVNTETHRMSDADASRFESIIRGHKINAIISGHVHYFSKEKFADIPVYTTPSSGQTPRFADKGRFGYIVMRMGKNGIESITPKYIEFSGPKREYLEAWVVRYILTQRVQELINRVGAVGLIFLVMGIVTRMRWRRKNNKL